MNRRNFLTNTLKGAMIPIFTGGVGISKVAGASFMPAGVCEYNGRVMVIIHLSGANDILNTTVPVSQFSTYQGLRKDIYIPENKLITLDDTAADNKRLGLHPALQSFKTLFDESQLSIIQRAGYPQPNRSHFASESIWLRGIEGGQETSASDEGWIGRFLRDRYPAFSGLPFGNQADPLGIMMGKGSDAGYHTEEEHSYHLNLSGQDPAGFYNVISALSGEPINVFPNSEHGDMLKYISAVEKSTQIYSERISQVHAAGRNVETYSDSDIGNQLKTVARFLSGGISTKVFFARTGGWDTHVNQLDSSDPTKGNHANLLKDLSDSLLTFQRDLKAMGLEKKVLTVVFSEFGRKAKQNEGGGTDHGTLSSMFLVGESVRKYVFGSNINLNNLDAQDAPNANQLLYDYRGAFSSLLKDWLGADKESVKAAFPNTPDDILFSDPSYIKGAYKVDDSCLFMPVQPAVIKVKGQVFLEGFIKPDGLMRTTLATQDKLPMNQPFVNFPDAPYFGDEEIVGMPPAGAVDWVLCELRTVDALVTVARKAALLRNDGCLMNPDGTAEIRFEGLFPEAYHLTVFHSSHVGVVSTGTTSSNPAVLNQFILDHPDKVMGKNQLKFRYEKYNLVSGDIDQNGVVNATDYRETLDKSGSLNYLPTDVNGNGKTDQYDAGFPERNRSRIGFAKLFPNLKS